MAEDFQLLYNTNILIAAPRKRLRKKRLKVFSGILADLEAVREAHIPELIEIGSPHPPGPALFVVIEPESATAAVMAVIQARLRDKGETLPVHAIALQHPLLQTIRATDCVIGWRD